MLQITILPILILRKNLRKLWKKGVKYTKMARKHSEIVERDGVRYRITPVDEEAEARRAAWGMKNYATVSTRIPRAWRDALDAYCTANGTRIYRLIRRYIRSILEADRKP